MSPRPLVPSRVLPPCLLVAALLAARPCGAVMDIADRGPILDAGRFAMRVTNVGVLGNAFFNQGLSFDPSFEFPRGSGHECLNHAELWVGGRLADGSAHVSGGPMLEFRPTLDPADHVLTRYAGDRGTRATVDDDGDGRVDEEILNGRDDDGDGEVDEDLRFPAQESAVATYVDDRPEALQSPSPTGEPHVPLGLTVEQEAYAWTLPGFDKIAGLQFTLTNHGAETLHDVWVGLYADLDSRDRNAEGGHLNDRVVAVNDSLVIHEGTSVLEGSYRKDCFTHLGGIVPAVADGVPGSGLPVAAVVGLSHTTDPLGWLVNHAFTGAREAQALARAPRRDTTFRYSIFANSLPPGEGGPPIVDAQRYVALQGAFAQADTTQLRDYAILCSCGPFPHLDPGQSVDVAFALVAAEDVDSLRAALQSALLAQRGTRLNLLPDATPGPGGIVPYTEGRTGITGHEVCYSPPPGIVFDYDPNCTSKFVTDPAYLPPTQLNPSTIVETTYRSDQPCVWSDFDCDACTGLDGRETQIPWFVAAPAPPQPTFRAGAGDRQVTVRWDNLPEILVNAGVLPGNGWTFSGYRVYRLDHWTRESLLPAPEQWQMLAAFVVDTALGGHPLASVVDGGVAYDSVAYEQRHYPVGRYRFTDPTVLDGFDYHYVVTAVAQKQTKVGTVTRTDFLESPFRTVFSDLVRPAVAATSQAGRVWVVPNPFRAHAPWERPPVPGDVFTRHVDFFGLP
ncbi:MAG TPA: hypothetical protein VGU27_00430, partial [Candidatus Eisenbacteria bacterium]|nr:hypothetical protein [Candidatus Eisenbacteria bacterium]